MVLAHVVLGQFGENFLEKKTERNVRMVKSLLFRWMSPKRGDYLDDHHDHPVYSGGCRRREADELQTARLSDHYDDHCDLVQQRLGAHPCHPPTEVVEIILLIVVEYFNTMDNIISLSSHSLIAIGKKVMQFSSNNFKSKISLYPSISELLKEI